MCCPKKGHADHDTLCKHKNGYYSKRSTTLRLGEVTATTFPSKLSSSPPFVATVSLSDAFRVTPNSFSTFVVAMFKAPSMLIKPWESMCAYTRSVVVVMMLYRVTHRTTHPGGIPSQVPCSPSGQLRIFHDSLVSDTNGHPVGEQLGHEALFCNRRSLGA